MMRAALALLLILGATVVALRVEGRVWWCDAGDLTPWCLDVWTRHCSQHLVDPYSLSHVCHGLFFWVVLGWAAPRVGERWRLVMAVGAAACWEVAENSVWVIERYRSSTMSLDYLGDSVANSVADLACCVLGFVAAGRLGARWTVALFVALELASLAWMRDNLTLNVVMLVHPFEAVRQWQIAGAP